MIGVLKKQIWRSFERKKYTHVETCTILQEATQVVNSHPLTAGQWAEKGPLCTEDLMLGRTRVRIPMAWFETGQQLIKVFKVVQEAKEEFGTDRLKRYSHPCSSRRSGSSIKGTQE
jgi:hypothetical protein